MRTFVQGTHPGCPRPYRPFRMCYGQLRVPPPVVLLHRKPRPFAMDQMPKQLIGITEANKLLGALTNLPVSLPWKGYGSAIFLELGKLAPLERPRQHHNKGEVCIFLEEGWRVEAASEVLYSSSSDRPSIAAGVEKLRGTKIAEICIDDAISEFQIHFSSGCRIVSSMTEAEAEWSIRLAPGLWLSWADNALNIGDGKGEL
jgi:hypothetical protein